MVLSLSARYQILEKSLALTLKRALFYLREPKKQVLVFLVADREIQRINGIFRGKDKATNVLSFEFDKRLPYPKALPMPLGEIYLAPDYIRRTNGDLAVLLVHGLVHLLGYTHEKARDKIRMETLERRILSKLKLRTRRRQR